VTVLLVKVQPIIHDVQELLAIEINTDGPEAIAAREAGETLAKEITDEGIILLKNTDDFLPLKEMKLNIFGAGAFEMRLSGGGSGAADVSRAINLFDSLNEVGVEYNDDLLKMYEEMGYSLEITSKSGLVGILSMLGSGGDQEPEINYLSDEVIKNAQAFSQNALIVLTSDSVEASDADVDQLRVKGNKLALIKKISEEFENVIIIINAGNTLELGFVEEIPAIKAVLSIGTPGATGPMSLAQTLVGELNPSGKLPNSIVYDNSSAPGTENFGDYKYENIDGIASLEYEEGIYVGYRYYETRYLNDEVGYQNAVIYPFGFGLSYTDFTWEILNYTFDHEKIQVEVTVKNTGNIAGKDVVQVYFEPPYYEGGIEKSAIVLADFKKTRLLEPGESETIIINYPTRQMASWDMSKEEAYVLEYGTYNINLSSDVHTTVVTMPFELEEMIVYKESIKGYSYENQFEYADGDLTYLSRTDWEGTYPTADDINLVAQDDVVKAYYAKPEKGEGEEPKTGADNGIMLSDLKGLSYDNPKWDKYLDQFTLEEMVKLYTRGGWKTIAIERLGIPSTTLLDGPAGINFFFSNVTAAAYPSALTLSSTWNDELIYHMGLSMGTEANAYGVEGIYAPAMNIHRTPYGGRNFEYYSEDPILSGKMGTAIIEGIQSKDVMVTMKHFILNEQEINARSGLFLWANEQSIRELYLKPFEYATNKTDVTGVMSSFIHIGHKWSGGNPELLNNVLRGEWGFDGFVTTDAYFGFMDPNLSIRYGNDLLLTSLTPSKTEEDIFELYRKDSVGIANGLRDRIHNLLYNILNKSKAVEKNI
jgi:beta-glucosidase